MLVQNIAVLCQRGHTWSTATWKIFRASGLHKPPSQTATFSIEAPGSSIPTALSLKCFAIRGIEILPKLYRYKSV